MEPGVAKPPRVYGSPSINPEGVASVPHVSFVKGNAVLFQKRTKLILKRNPGMVFRLVCDVGAHGLRIRCAHRKSPVSRLPRKFCNMWEALLNPKVGTSLEFFHQIGLGNAATQLDQNMDMIGNSTDQNGRAIEFLAIPPRKA